MIRIDRILLGYRVFSVSPDSIAQAATALLAAGIAASFDERGFFTVPARRVRAVRAALGNIPFELSPLRGLPGLWIALRRRPGVIAALAIVLLLRLLTAGRVWDIRIEREEGDSDFSSALILEELEEAGLAVGDRWSRIDRDGVETALLSSSSHIGWVSITRTGAVAHVKVREKTKFRGEPVAEEDGYANIVAAFDCVIEEITVVRGFAVVSVGDTVRAGDLLISGILPEEAGGGFCRAEGSVLGRLHESVEVSCERLHREKVFGNEEYRAVSLQFLKFSLNILKNSRNCEEDCVIIEETRVPVLPGGAVLPLKLRITRALLFDRLDEEAYTDDALVRIASRRLSAEMVRRFASADLLGVRTTGEFTEDGYRLRADAQILREIGRTAGISENE